jgi:hypothetical protein
VCAEQPHAPDGLVCQLVSDCCSSREIDLCEQLWRWQEDALMWLFSQLRLHAGMLPCLCCSTQMGAALSMQCCTQLQLCSPSFLAHRFTHLPELWLRVHGPKECLRRMGRLAWGAEASKDEAVGRPEAGQIRSCSGRPAAALLCPPSA